MNAKKREAVNVLAKTLGVGFGNAERIVNAVIEAVAEDVRLDEE